MLDCSDIIFRHKCIDFLALVGGEFIVAIMIYYAIIYFIKTYAVNKIPMIIVLCGLVSLFVYIFLFPYKYETGVKGLYGTSTLFRWLPYFAFMLFGAGGSCLLWL